MRYERPGAALVETRLARALIATAAAALVQVEVAEHRSRPWTSATYVGTRHRIVLMTPRSAKLGGWVSALPDAELAMHDHIVASIAVDRIKDDGVAVALTLDVLTIEES